MRPRSRTAPRPRQPSRGSTAAATWAAAATGAGWAAALALLLPTAANAQDWATGRTRGFAFSYFWFDVYESAQDCPDGYALALRDLAIRDLPETEQKRLLQPENRSEYYLMGYALARRRNQEADGESMCDVPETWEDPPHRTVQGSVSFGVDIDGHTSTPDDPGVETCPHQDFTSPDGTPGIDNQLYRVMGCVDSYRRDPLYAGGAFEDYHIGAYRDGEVSTLLEVRGLDDPANDDDVEVGVYSSIDPTPYDGEKRGLPWASLTMTDNPAWRNETRGRVVDGVLITDPFDLRLGFGWAGRDAEYYIRGARIRLELRPDGSAVGTLVGYWDVEAAYQHMFRDQNGALQVANGFTCPAVHKAIWELADGYPDPETGKCTAISTSMKIEAVPAFVIHAPSREPGEAGEAREPEPMRPPAPEESAPAED